MLGKSDVCNRLIGLIVGLFGRTSWGNELTVLSRPSKGCKALIVLDGSSIVGPR